MDYMETVDSLLIIGNGFDLSCKLKSRFSDYYSFKCEEKIKNVYDCFKKKNIHKLKNYINNIDDSVNFWTFLMYIQFYSKEDNYKINDINDNNWFDIEMLIRRSLIEKYSGGFALNYYFNIAINFDKDDSSNLDLFNCIIWKNPFVFFFYFWALSFSNMYDFLMIELHKFENDFKRYLKSEINDEYYKNCHKLLINIIDEDFDYVDILNFNYTTFRDDNLIRNQINIHGQLSDDEVIIGFDSNNVEKEELYRFTKTYRNIHRSKEIISLPKEVLSMIFYGHSLADADFSYFYSLFDMYDLYNGEVKLIFLYSDYEKENDKNDKNHNNYVERVYRLIGRYSSQSHNDNNLLHRLLLEGRIIIKKIEVNYE